MLGARPVKVPVVPAPVVVTSPGLAVIVQVPDDGKSLKAILPVAIVHVGCVIVPTTGAVGASGAVLITTLEVATEVQPDALVTVNVYVFAAKPVKVPVVPVPVVVTPPGLAVIVQVPDDGKPLKATLPVAVAHVGCVMVSTTGTVGAPGAALITTSEVATEVQPDELSVTVKLYVEEAKPLIVIVVPEPLIAPGLIVQEPDGRPLNTTLPVVVVQVGCVIVSTTGAVGVPGAALITTLEVAAEVQPDALVTVNV